jgi:hypothetical protein
LYWAYPDSGTNPANYKKVATTPPPIDGTQFKFILYFSSGRMLSVSTYTDATIKYKYAINSNYSIQYSTMTSLKSALQPRGFSDVAIDFSNSSLKYCRIDVISGGHPVFM